MNISQIHSIFWYNELGVSGIDTSRILDDLIIKANEQSYHCLNGIYKKLAELIGFEATVKLHSEFGGGYLSLPKKLLSDEYVYQCILKEYNGTNAREIAKSLDCTYSWILKIIKKKGGLKFKH